MSNGVAICADLHFGNHRLFGGEMIAGLNDRFRMCQQVLQKAIAVANNKQCGVFAVLGDVFDTTRPSPQMIAAVASELRNFRGEVVLVAGNHDKASDAPGDNALAPLSPEFRVVDDDPYELINSRIRFFFAPYKSGPAPLWIEDYKSRMQTIVPTSTGRNILATHVGLITKKTPPWLRVCADAVDAPAAKSDIQIVAGNWHAHAVINDSCQVGALVPTGFDNPTPIHHEDPYGSLMIYGPTHQNTRHVVPGPRFHIVDFVASMRPRDQVLTRILATDINFVKLRADLSEVGEAQTVLDDLVRDGRIRGGLVEPCAQDKKLRDQQAISAVLNSTSLDDAIVSYLKKQELPEGILMARVAEAVREYVKQGSKVVGSDV